MSKPDIAIQNKISSRTYTPGEAAMYLTGMFGQNVIYNIVATGLYFYFQNVICLPAVALGWIFALARVWDAVNDPMMGSIIDRTHSKWGKCKPYLLFAPPIICLVTCVAFLNGNYATAKEQGNSTAMVLIVAWAAISYILWGMTYTVGDIPLWGIISRMSEVENDRAKLISLSRIVASVGAAAGVVSVVTLSQAANKSFGLDTNAQKGFIVVGMAMTIISSILFEFTGLGTKERVPMGENEEKKNMIESLKLMWTCKPFRRILISGIVRSPLQLMMTIAITLFTYYYCDGDVTKAFTDIKKFLVIGIIGGGLFIGQFLAMALCPMLIKKFDVTKLYNIFSGGSAAFYALIYVVYKMNPTDTSKFSTVILYGICFLVAGIGFGGVNVCQSVMISDCIDYEEYKTGYRPDGIFFSGQSFIVKLSAGVASLISAYVYNAVGYTDVNISKMNTAIENGASFAKDFTSYSDAMWLLISIPPAIGMLLAVIPTLKYEFTSKEHQVMLDELIKKHTETEKGE